MASVGASTSSRFHGHSVVFLSIVGFMHVILVLNADITTLQTNVNRSNNNVTTGLLKIASVCPGVDYILNHDTGKNTLRQANMSRCLRLTWFGFTKHQGAVYGVCGGSTVYCRLHAEVPRGTLVVAHIQRLVYWCESSPWQMRVYGGYTKRSVYAIKCDVHSSEDIIIRSYTNHMFFLHENSPLVKIDFQAIRDYNFIVSYTSELSGYVILPCLEYDLKLYFNLSVELKAPSETVIMTSFETKFIYSPAFPCLRLSYRETNSHHQSASRVCGKHDLLPRVFLTSLLHIHFYMQLNIDQVRCLSSYHKLFHKIVFSFLSQSNPPQKLSTGLFNCSIDYYSSFQQHVDCNLKPECEEGQDETELCPFSSPGCQGLVTSRNKCYQYLRLNQGTHLKHLKYKCSELGSRLASIKTRREQEVFLHFFKQKDFFNTIIGSPSGWKSVPYMYKKFRKWSDNTIIYNMDHIKSTKLYSPSSVVMYMHILKMELSYRDQDDFQIIQDVTCETKSQYEHFLPVQKVKFSNLHFRLSSIIHVRSHQILFPCFAGHVTHSFLICDPGSYCGNTTYSKFCESLEMSAEKNYSLGNPRKSRSYTIAMFGCENDITTVPYTLVCDFREDCPDDSDESFCVHPSCDKFMCFNGQCLPFDTWQNDYSDCLDDSDEFVSYEELMPSREAARKQQLFIRLDGAGYFSQQMMKPDESCPDTHYWCTEDWMYCLPVYTRCNGFSDCTYGEDEQDCATMTCPGFYRCWSSKVCVHGDHVCDGWSQCPQRDDEWMCKMTCPEDCHCQGYSFVCSKPFPAERFTSLRYLDARGSGMLLTSFSSNVYLISLTLSHCSLVDIPSMNLSNLQFIDLVDNRLKTVNMIVFSDLSNLKILLLANNPLLSLTSKPFNVHYSLMKLDVSKTLIKTFNNKFDVYLPQVQHLNISFCAIETIGSTYFSKNLPQVAELDIRGNLINSVDFTFLSELSHLKTVFSSNFRFCCENLYQSQSSKMRCSAPKSLFFSCTKLLPTNLYKFIFWLFASIAIIGNLVSFIAPFITKKTFLSNFITFLAHLWFANLCMGIHITIVVAADEMPYGSYIYFEKAWTRSAMCKMAGFLFLLSSEVSVLILWITTLDLVIIVCFPLTRWRFSRHSTATACAVTWCVGVVLSMVPFVPRLAHWGLSDQSGLCRMALYYSNDSKETLRWVTVTALFNFIICFVVVVGQVIINRKTPKCRIIIDSTDRSLYLSTHLLVKLAITDLLCWFPFGVIGVMNLCHISVSGRIHVGMVVFLIPLNSALNPLLYIWELASQRRQRSQEDRMMLLYKARLSLP